MHVVEQVGGDVVVREWRWDYSAHNDEFLFSDDGVQPLCQDGLYSGDRLLPCHRHDAVVH